VQVESKLLSASVPSKRTNSTWMLNFALRW